MLQPTFMSSSGQYFKYNEFQVKYWPEDDLIWVETCCHSI